MFQTNKINESYSLSIHLMLNSIQLNIHVLLCTWMFVKLDDPLEISFLTSAKGIIDEDSNCFLFGNRWKSVIHHTTLYIEQ